MLTLKEATNVLSAHAGTRISLFSLILETTFFSAPQIK